jgi:3-dehydroquinate dehydratase
MLQVPPSQEKGVLDKDVTETSSPSEVDVSTSHHDNDHNNVLEPQYTKEGNMILPYHDHACTKEADVCKFIAPAHRAAYHAL